MANTDDEEILNKAGVEKLGQQIATEKKVVLAHVEKHQELATWTITFRKNGDLISTGEFTLQASTRKALRRAILSLAFGDVTE